MGIMVGDNADKGMDTIMAHIAMETEETLITDTIIRIREEAVVTQKGTFKIIKEEVKIIHLEGKEDNGMVATPLIVTGDNRDRNSDGQNNSTEVKDGMVIEAREIVTKGEGENGTLISNTNNQVTHNNLKTLTQITTVRHQ